ncbi:hypothetical protein RND71_040884 [Anisodus tanguticus]|uniref:Uncharacterized protein n=1 Tax=Anisodus tanguticus TaxID=243964 RepID=A0AAE1QWK6_9SOLA|nr:hypothetical protein RND71_040884 [Anisodus tanguticus]
MESKVGEIASEYQDLLPVTVEKLDVDTFVKELCGGFQLLSDPMTGLITPALLGMEGMSREDAEALVREGDLDGDGLMEHWTKKNFVYSWSDLAQRYARC